MQNNNYIQSPLANAMRGAYNQPIYTPQPVVQQPVNLPQLTPEQYQAIMDWKAQQPTEPAQATQLRENWRGYDVDMQGHPILSEILSPIRNIPQDLGQIGTGLVYQANQLRNDPIGTIKGGLVSARDYLNELGRRADTEGLTGVPTLDKILSANNAGIRMAQLGAKDLWNTFQGTLPVLNTKRTGEIIEDLRNGDGNAVFNKVKDLGADTWEQIKYDPLITGLSVAPNATVGAIGKGGKAALNLAEKAGVPIGEVSQKVAKAVQTVESKFLKEKYDLQTAAEDLTKANDADLVKVLQNMTEGTPLPENLQPLKDKFIKFNKDYNLTFDDNALVNPNELAALEYVQRQTGKTMQEIRRELTPQLDALQEGVNNPSISFKNRLASFENDVNNFRKTEKDFLKDSTKLESLTDKELSTIKSHLSNEEFNLLKPTDSIKDVKQYLGQATRDSWNPLNVSEAALKDVRFRENMGKLASLAEETGNPMYKHLYDGMKLANERKISPYTMAGAEIPEKGLVSNEGRRFQGRSSSREYGTASYENIAKAYRNVHEFLDDVTHQRMTQEISNNILNNGTIDGVNKIFTEGTNPKNIRYLNSELLRDGRLSEAIARASEKPLEGGIPIDNINLKALKTTTMPANAPYKRGVWGDAYNLFKESALASGIYLGGNLASGAFGTLLNSGTPNGLIKDIVASIGSKGALSKELGTLRKIRPTDRKYATQTGKVISKVGRKLGTGWAPRIDAAMQNLFSEINAHANLRRMGVNESSRLNAIANMDKIKLANLIDNVRTYSMMNNKFRIIPRGETRDIASIANPFIDWTDTATQVTAKMLLDHPVLMGAATSKFLGDISYDKELQNRLNLGVYTDKPLVSYKQDPKTGDLKETSISFLPQLTTLEVLRKPSTLITGISGAPVLSAIFQASQGKNVYGNLMKRSHTRDTIQTIQGNARYRVNPKTGTIERITETQPDEMLSTAIRNLIAPVNLINKTVMPLAVGAYNAVTGSDAKYYMPYGQSIFGNVNVGQPERGGLDIRTIFSTGDPSRARSVKDILEGLGTYYERPYFPENQMTGQQIRNVIRRGVRQNLRDFGEE